MKKLFIILLVTAVSVGCSAHYARKYPLHDAVYKENIVQVQAMVKSGASIEERDNSGLTPLLSAVYNGGLESVRTLLNLGADINSPDAKGTTPLLYAILGCNPEIVSFLVERGARTDIKTKKKNGWTALHYAVSGCPGSIEKAQIILNILLEKGCDIAAVDDNGHTAYWTAAVEYWDMDMVAFLRRKGAMERCTGGPGGGFDEVLRKPSWYTPPDGSYAVAVGRETNYQMAIEDCNCIIAPSKTGLLLATGPVGYAASLIADQIRNPEKFQKCMEKMGFKCVNNCAK